ncbi:uncharacterized protein LOC122510639 [Leptopilina heterotoma]|uniref:uncharacterized protein LOC122510639 n=1 Tax=Leptopilina heterotoma TaxID=63436 RepID=UPI001CAA0CBD|nr:uncharacterized protein LOC122510639 [Leptopilina heterotoma]
MHSKSKFLIALTLISLLMVEKNSIYGRNHVEDTGIRPFKVKNDICCIYDNSLVIDYMLFKRKYKPLVVIIADKFIDSINRVRSLSDNKRILNDNRIKKNPYYSQLYQIILENIYLFQANDTYYFIYPVEFQDHFLTIYSQKKLLDINLGITFDFVNVKKEFPFYEDILIPLEPSCTNCTLVKYVNEKIQKGESFSELFELRKQLFREKETKNLSSTEVNDYDICDSIRFYINPQSMSSLLHFNSTLNKIQNNRESAEKNKRFTVERSLICLQSRGLEVTEEIISRNQSKPNLRKLMNTMDYLHWIINTVFSLKSNDSSFGSLCENKHELEILKLFCFMKQISDVTSHNIPMWIDHLKRFVAKPLIRKIDWFRRIIFLHTNDYIIGSDAISSVLDDLKQKMLTVSENLSYLMNNTYKIVVDSLSVNTSNAHTPTSRSICTIYEHWKTIDDLLLEVKFKKLVIIVTDNMRTLFTTVKQIRNITVVVPKLKRKDLHHTEQFLYDEIMKHIYLFQRDDTHYYVYPTTINRYRDSLISYIEYKMIKDYSNVLFYFVNSTNYFSFDKPIHLDHNDLIVPALPEYCSIYSGNCQKRFINPLYLIKVHQEFHNQFPEYISTYASLYENLTKFITNKFIVYTGVNYMMYSKKFYEFFEKRQIFFDTIYTFKDLPCLITRKLNNRTDIDFSMTELGDVFYFKNLLQSAHLNIMLIKDTNSNNLRFLCNNKEMFKFLKFYCFLKINYINMLKVIDQKSYKISDMKSIVENEENYVLEYLLKTNEWVDKLFSMNYIDYKYNETRMFKESDALYSQIPKITSNGTDLSNKIYSIVKNSKIFLQCQELKNIFEEEQLKLCLEDY